MSDEEDEEVLSVKKAKTEAPTKRRKKLRIPRRAPSTVVPPREVVCPSPDRNTCDECPCYPKEDPYVKKKKLIPCLKSPLTLYELAANVVENFHWPAAFGWSERQVVDWLSELGLPQYQECIYDNHINGLRLLMLEDPSRLPMINIHDFEHIKLITRNIRKLYGTDFIKFFRSVGLPPRYPLTHCTWFKSRTGPSWGIRENWSRLDILRWMKIMMPAPVYLDHWDFVWYQAPDFPKVKFARIKYKPTPEHIPRYCPRKIEICREYQVPRKFRLQSGIPESEQMIWMEQLLPKPRQKKITKKKQIIVPIRMSLMPKIVDPTGLRGKEFVLARRKMAKPKFAPQT